MSAKDLSILIPARNEMFLTTTIEDILKNIEADTEVIAVMDGDWADPPIPQNDRVNIIKLSESIGQRAATNLACKLSRAKYVMKIDAHCAFDKGFDRKMLDAFAETGDNVTMVPIMRNLWAFDWKCYHCGWKKYQGPTPEKCEQCGKSDKIRRKMMWIGKHNPQSTSYCFDSTPHFQYFEDWKHRPQYEKDKLEKGLTESMSLQGSCWMLTRDKYWELDISEEAFGGWGSQGIEVAVKTWLSGGRVVVNHRTWYAHMFRTQGGDFGFPYPIKSADQEKARRYARELFFDNNWSKQIRPLSWLIEKFWPVRGWTDEDLKKLKQNTFRFKVSPEPKPVESEPTDEVIGLGTTGIIYQAAILSKGIIFYTDNQLNIKIAVRVQRQLAKISQRQGIPIVSASLKPMGLGKNIYLPLTRGYLTMFKQILAALTASSDDIIFLCEHDVLYHPTHFDFTPTDKNTFYYNQNVWLLRTTDGHALHYDVNQLSGLCGYREALITHFTERVETTEKALKELDETEFRTFIRNMGFEPMTHGRVKWQNIYKIGVWKSEYPNVDIRYGDNITGQRWSKEQFRNQKFTAGWLESDSEIPGWGKTADLIKKFN